MKRKEAIRERIEKKVFEIKSKGSSEAAPCSSSMNIDHTDYAEAPTGLLQETCRAMLRTLAEKPQQEDEYDLLCLSLGAKMKKLPPKQQRWVGQSFMATICKAEAEAAVEEKKRYLCFHHIKHSIVSALPDLHAV